MNLSPTTSSASSSSSSSSTSTSTLHPNPGLSAAYRRRSVDNGGLNLAVNDHSGSGSGRGWGAWEAGPMEALPGSIDIAELVLAMREQTNTAIDHAYTATSTTFLPPSELDAQREKLIRRLATWHFDASNLAPDEVLMCASLLFETLCCVDGMEESIGIEFDSIPPFLARISKIYREKTSYHNFQHALDVLQAVHCYLVQAGCVPSIKILLNQESEQETWPPPSQTEAAVSDTILSTPRRRKVWRRSPSEGKSDTLIRRALRNQDLFALYVAGIGHDIGHPGLSNTFMKNAKTPLAELFDDASVLEKMHCTLILQVLRTHRMGHLLDRFPSPYEARFSSPIQSRPRTESDPGFISRNLSSALPDSNGADMDVPRAATPLTPLPTRPLLKKSVSAYPDPYEAASSAMGTEFRNLLMKTILATDMGVHFEWMLEMEKLGHKLVQCTEWQGGEEMGLVTGEVDPQTRLLLCQALIKCADISNPSRPDPICRHWSWSLLAEWTEQALLERQLELPISVSTSDDPVQEAKGQISFIEACAQPLLMATSAVIPEMDVFVKKCNNNLAMWKAKIEDLQSKVTVNGSNEPDASPPADTSPVSLSLSLPTSPPDVSTMFALSLPAALYTPSPELRTQPSWIVSDPSSSPRSMATRAELEAQSDEHTEPSISPDSRSPSPPTTSAIHSTHHPTHHRHSSHTQLPQVSIPASASTSFSPLNSQHAKSSSTTSASSPLFSPRSIPTSSSSPRSDLSSPGSGVSAGASTLGIHFRPGLRAAYDAHGRSKAIKKFENRTSWQGTVTVADAPNSGTPSNSMTSPEADPTPQVQPHVSNGS